MIYPKRTNGKEHGSVFTNESTVNFILSLSGLNTLSDFCSKKILEPAAGEGAFLNVILSKILNLAGNYQETIISALKNITVIEIDPLKVDILLKNINNIFSNYGLDYLYYKDYLRVISADFLLFDFEKYDVIIGNPPYIRYDNIPMEQRVLYKEKFSCFKNRCDLYILFFEKALSLLKENGILTFICSDRWINNQYGSALRLKIHNNFNFYKYIKISNFNPFTENVLAYPGVFSIKNSKERESSFTEISNESDMNVSYVSTHNSLLEFYENGDFKYDSQSKNCVLIEEQGFKIGVGLATGADDIFILKNNIYNIEQDVLLPIVTRKDFKNHKLNWENRFVINPFRDDILIDLNEYPNLRKYLENNSKRLKARYIARKNEKNWYRTIDKIDLELSYKPKLLIPDISIDNFIYYDSGKFYPHHNFYYITGKSNIDLLVLQAILSTEFVKKQIQDKGIVMNGGALRWQAQTLRKVFIPNVSQISEKEKQKIIYLYDTNNKTALETVFKKFIA